MSRVSGEPLADTMLWAIDASGKLLAANVSDSTGAAVLSPAASGDVAVIAQRSGYVPFRSKAIQYPSHSSVTFKLDVGGSLFGQVLDSSGMPIAGARLLVRQRSSTSAAPARTGAIELLSGQDGGFAIQGCAPGSYSIVASHGDYIADVPVVSATPGTPCKIAMRPAEVAVVQWRTRGGDAVFPRGEILLDGNPVDPGLATERAAYWEAAVSRPGALSEGFQAGQVLLSLHGRQQGTNEKFLCRARLTGFKPVETMLKKWRIQDVLEGRAVVEAVELEPDANSVGVHLHVSYSDSGEAVRHVLPVSIHALPSGSYYTGVRLSLQRPGDAFVVLPPGNYEVRLGYPYQTLGRHEIRIDASPGDAMPIDIKVNRGADLVLVPSPELGPGVLVQLTRESGSADGFDTGVFAMRAVAPVTWGDMPSGRYRVRHQGVQGTWLESAFSLTQGESYELAIRP